MLLSRLGSAEGKTTIRQGKALLKNAALIVRIGRRGFSEGLPPGSTLFLFQAPPLLPGRDPGGDARVGFPGCSLELPPEAAQSDHPVPMLASFLSCGDHQAGREVRQSDTGFGAVLMLASLTPGSKRVDPALGQEFLVGFRE